MSRQRTPLLNPMQQPPSSVPFASCGSSARVVRAWSILGSGANSSHSASPSRYCTLRSPSSSAINFSTTKSVSSPLLTTLASFASSRRGGYAGGSHYIVMKYVDGLSILDYCTRHNPGEGERLTLLLEILQAVDSPRRTAPSKAAVPRR
jgi:serine/threonine protein kinase